MLRAMELHLTTCSSLERFVEALVMVRAWTPRAKVQIAAIPTNLAVLGLLERSFSRCIAEVLPPGYSQRASFHALVPPNEDLCRQVLALLPSHRIACFLC